MHLAHYAKLAANPSERKVYCTFRKDYYWHAMAFDAYATVRTCLPCTKNYMKLWMNSKKLMLFPARATLEVFAIDVLDEFIQTPWGDNYLLVLTDGFCKITQTVPLKRIDATTAP